MAAVAASNTATKAIAASHSVLNAIVAVQRRWMHFMPKKSRLTGASASNR